jgi:hypothetical protein
MIALQKVGQNITPHSKAKEKSRAQDKTFDQKQDLMYAIAVNRKYFWQYTISIRRKYV